MGDINLLLGTQTNKRWNISVWLRGMYRWSFGIRQTNIGDASVALTVISWQSHGDGIVPCGDHIKAGKILRGTTYMNLVAAEWDHCVKIKNSNEIYNISNVQRNIAIASPMLRKTVWEHWRASTMDHPNHRRYYHIEYTSPIFTRACWEHRRCVCHIFNLDVPHRMFADCCALLGAVRRYIADGSWRRNIRRKCHAMVPREPTFLEMYWRWKNHRVLVAIAADIERVIPRENCDRRCIDEPSRNIRRSIAEILPNIRWCIGKILINLRYIC